MQATVSKVQFAEGIVPAFVSNGRRSYRIGRTKHVADLLPRHSGPQAVKRLLFGYLGFMPNPARLVLDVLISESRIGWSGIACGAGADYHYKGCKHQDVRGVSHEYYKCIPHTRS